MATDDRAVLTGGTGVTVQWSAMQVTEQGSAMHHTERHSAAARDGPLANAGGLTIAKQDGSDRWPTPVVWATSAGERHLYELMAVKVDLDLVPSAVYAFLRTLRAREAEPEISWVLPSRYLM